MKKYVLIMISILLLACNNKKSNILNDIQKGKTKSDSIEVNYKLIEKSKFVIGTIKFGDTHDEIIKKIKTDTCFKKHLKGWYYLPIGKYKLVLYSSDKNFDEINDNFFFYHDSLYEFTYQFHPYTANEYNLKVESIYTEIFDVMNKIYTPQKYNFPLLIDIKEKTVSYSNEWTLKKKKIRLGVSVEDYEYFVVLNIMNEEKSKVKYNELQKKRESILNKSIKNF